MATENSQARTRVLIVDDHPAVREALELRISQQEELEVFRLIGQGVKTAQIGRMLFLSIKTIETYRDRIRAKLALPTGAQLASYAAQWVLENHVPEVTE